MKSETLAVEKAGALDKHLAKLEQATRMLAECRTPQDAKKIADIAAAAIVYAKRQKLGKEAEQTAKGICVDAMTAMGELLAQAPKAKGGQPYQAISTASKTEWVEKPTLESIGISQKESQESQALARAKQEAPDVHRAARIGKVSPRYVAEIMAKVRPMTPEQIAERDQKARIKIETRRYREIVQLVVVGECSNQEGRDFIARHLTIEPFSIHTSADTATFSPETMKKAGEYLKELALTWKELSQ